MNATKTDLKKPLTEADVELECTKHQVKWMASSLPPTTEGQITTYYCPEGCVAAVVTAGQGTAAMEYRSGGFALHIRP